MHPPSQCSVVVLLAAFGVCLGGFGCEDRAGDTKTLVPNPVSFTRLHFDNAGRWRHYAPAHYVIRNENQWQRMWRRAHLPVRMDEQPTPPTPPPVDFKSEMILAAFQGQCPSGGWGVMISDVGETDEQLTVVVKYREPGPDENTTAVMTSPFWMVSVPQSDKPVGFRIVEVIGPL